MTDRKLHLKTKRKILFFFFLGIASALYSQEKSIPEPIQHMFEGTWIYNDTFQTNTIVILFEPDKDYAVFRDIGNGMAPSRTLHAFQKENLLVIPAVQHGNDYTEMRVIQGKLHVRTKPINWDDKGHIVNSGPLETRVFKRSAHKKKTSGPY
ncbi:hypothetical protein [Sphingobacterium suaedae]|uniref:DUF4488 domain-containing protein n=1 Tax=Sphingobacterium suaedae TaxID=1686402 RepID=A0ABW5KEP4_9SPHI